MLQSLAINDNDFSTDGGECIGVALSQNDSLKTLKIAENELSSEGAIPIINSAVNLEVLSLAKNNLKSDVGKPLEKLLKKSKVLRKLSLEYNDLMVAGTKCLAEGMIRNNSLESLNVKGNVIGDQGMELLATGLLHAPNIKELDVSLNEIGPAGFSKLCEVLPHTGLTTLVCNKNFLGDPILELFAEVISGPDGCGATQLRKFDFSTCRLNDTGLLFLIKALENNKMIS
jgi:Ran GTPase-activating protein (RanGAP) involved in mRNA processing and transport